jgi:hypothetical protein
MPAKKSSKSSSSSEEPVEGNLSIKNLKRYFKYNHYKKLLINPKEEIKDYCMYLIDDMKKVGDFSIEKEYSNKINGVFLLRNIKNNDELILKIIYTDVREIELYIYTKLLEIFNTEDKIYHFPVIYLITECELNDRNNTYDYFRYFKQLKNDQIKKRLKTGGTLNKRHITAVDVVKESTEIDEYKEYIDEIKSKNINKYSLIFTKLAINDFTKFIFNLYNGTDPNIDIDDVQNSILQIMMSIFYYHTKLNCLHNDTNLGNFIYYKLPENANDISYSIGEYVYKYIYKNKYLWSIWDFETSLIILPAFKLSYINDYYIFVDNLASTIEYCETKKLTIDDEIKTFFEEFIAHMREIKENKRIIVDEEVFIKNILGFFAEKEIID